MIIMIFFWLIFVNLISNLAILNIFVNLISNLAILNIFDQLGVREPP